jgi:hypothetical protein
MKRNNINKKLEDEGKLATEILQGKVIRVVWRPTEKQVGIEFTDGTRFFIDHQSLSVEMSITGP